MSACTQTSLIPSLSYPRFSYCNSWDVSSSAVSFPHSVSVFVLCRLDKCTSPHKLLTPSHSVRPEPLQIPVDGSVKVHYIPFTYVAVPD